jgi:ParB-like chromosome segregation protein Spo0J
MGRDPVTDENVIYYTAGYTRREAIDVANSELPEDKKIKAVSMVMQPPKTTTMRQLNALLITENELAELDPYEASIVCKRLLDDNLSVEEIAVEVNFSTEWVNSLLQLAAAPIELQLMVVDEVIKPTFAIETIKEHGDQAPDILKAALARKTGGAAAPVAEPAPTADPDGTDPEGEAAPVPKKVRLTAKDLTSPEARKFQNAVRREAPGMYVALASVTKDPAFDTLAPETHEKLLASVAKLARFEVPSGEPDPRQTALFDSETAAEGSAPSASADTSAAQSSIQTLRDGLAASALLLPHPSPYASPVQVRKPLSGIEPYSPTS